VTGVTPGNCIAGAEVEEEDSSGLWLEVTKVAMVCCVTMPGMVIIWLDTGNGHFEFLKFHHLISKKKENKKKEVNWKIWKP
jgi:hypothetical protein